MKGSSLTLHPEEEQLLRYLDGELPAPAASEVRSHLEACWQCRAALEDLQDVVSQCVHYRKNVLQRHLPAPPAPWVDIHRHFDEIDASLEPAFFNRLVRLLQLPFDTAAKKWAVAAAALLVLLGLFYRYRQTPAVHASELLHQAVVAANAHPSQLRRIQIRTRDRRVTRPAVAPARKAGFSPPETETLLSIEAMFERANYSWSDPLSARSFQDWRSGLAEKRDQVSVGNQAYRIETSTGASPIRQATLTLRTADLRPVEERLEFSNTDWVEITEVADDSTPLASGSAREDRLPVTSHPGAAVPETSGATSTPAALANASDELQVVAALHDVGADLGDPIQISRSGGSVVVSGAGIAPARRQEIENAIGSKPHVVVRFSDSSPPPREQPVAPPEPAAGADVRQLQTRLADQLGGRANLEQFAAEVLDSSETLMARAFALRRLAEQFPVSAERQLSVTDLELLRRLRAEHSAALRRQASGIDRELRRILPTLPGAPGTAPDNGIPSEPWQAATEDLFQSARSLDKLLGVMFGAAPSDLPAGQIPARLNASLVQLQARLDIYERSNK